MTCKQEKLVKMTNVLMDSRIRTTNLPVRETKQQEIVHTFTE